MLSAKNSLSHTGAYTHTCTICWLVGILSPGRKHGALRPQKPLRLIRDQEIGGSGIFISNNYSLHCHHQNDSALRWAAVWAILMFHLLCGKSHKTSVHKAQFLKGKESWSGLNWGLSAYLPSALPLGHTSSPLSQVNHKGLYQGWAHLHLKDTHYTMWRNSNFVGYSK